MVPPGHRLDLRAAIEHVSPVAQQEIVGKGRQRQGLSVRWLPGQLPDVLVIGLGARRGHGQHRREPSIEPEPVALDGAAQLGSALEVVAQRLPGDLDRHPVEESGAVQLIATGLGDRLDDPASHAPVPRTQAARPHVHLFDEMLEQPAALLVRAGVGDVQAVDAVARAGRGRPEDLQPGRLYPGRDDQDARGGDRGLFIAALIAPVWDELHPLARDHGAALGRGHREHGDLDAEPDGRGHPCVGHDRKVHADAASGVDHQPLLRERLVPLGLHVQGVLAGRQQADLELAVGVGPPAPPRPPRVAPSEHRRSGRRSRRSSAPPQKPPARRKPRSRRASCVRGQISRCSPGSQASGGARNGMRGPIRTLWNKSSHAPDGCVDSECPPV